MQLLALLFRRHSSFLGGKLGIAPIPRHLLKERMRSRGADAVDFLGQLAIFPQHRGILGAHKLLRGIRIDVALGHVILGGRHVPARQGRHCEALVAHFALLIEPGVRVVLEQPERRRAATGDIRQFRQDRCVEVALGSPGRTGHPHWRHSRDVVAVGARPTVRRDARRGARLHASAPHPELRQIRPVAIRRIMAAAGFQEGLGALWSAPVHHSQKACLADRHPSDRLPDILVQPQALYLSGKIGLVLLECLILRRRVIQPVGLRHWGHALRRDCPSPIPIVVHVLVGRGLISARIQHCLLPHLKEACVAALVDDGRIAAALPVHCDVG